MRAISSAAVASRPAFAARSSGVMLNVGTSPHSTSGASCTTANWATRPTSSASEHRAARAGASQASITVWSVSDSGLPSSSRVLRSTVENRSASSAIFFIGQYSPAASMLVVGGHFGVLLVVIGPRVLGVVGYVVGWCGVTRVGHGLDQVVVDRCGVGRAGERPPQE